MAGLKSRIVTTAVAYLCKILLTKVQFIDRGQLKSKLKDLHNEQKRCYKNFVTEYNKDGGVQKSQNSERHEYKTLKEINLKKSNCESGFWFFGLGLYQMT